MDRNVALFKKCAQEMQLPYTYYPTADVLKVELGAKPYYFVFSISPINYGASIYVAKHKYACNTLLHQAGFPVPKAVAFEKKKLEQHSLSELIEPLRFPLVAKPMLNSVRGLGVLCNIKNIAELSEYVNTLFNNHRFVQIEEFHSQLKEYRVTVLNNKVIGVLIRTGAFVIGDGKHTIEELIELKNVERIHLSKELTISPLRYDTEYKSCLEEQGLTLQSIVPEGNKIRLCYTVNTGRGGDIFSLGKKIHPANAKMVCDAARAIGLNYVGFDLLCEDIINTPFKPNKWIIIEANFYADATLHEIPNHGVKTKIINKMLRHLIYRHPFSYLYHLCMHSCYSKYFKSGLLLLILLFVINTIYMAQNS
ncbi:UDP-N-acetylmuramyl peptide synthase [uncultured Legionella sp.]|uniref:UDP-N-acetylmuramyl peptide synthase n=1 Tax=uncultured Legionella sp. TaxID=210934 RepID=UPI002611F542|nr:UDP-N-acetylmuramyl peptide synthase [uncultured Legionella sp.]